MRVGLYTDALAHRPLPEALDWLVAAAPEVRELEVGVGGYSAAPHCDLARLLAEAGARRTWFSELDSRGFRLAALNVSGNPLHPDPVRGAPHDAALRNAVRLAALLGVDRVVAMSGCPAAGEGDRAAPHFTGGWWMPGVEDVIEWQWQERVLPYWEELSAFARSEHPALRICFELEPGACAYNVATFERISQVGSNLAVNLDPSHFFWQTIDPLAAARKLGGAVGFAHGKDVAFRPELVALNGVLHSSWPGAPAELPWSYSTVGRGHDLGWWSSFVEELGRAGYDGPVSIEYEDPFLSPEESIVEAARLLDVAIAARVPA